jgi:septum formation protein
VLGKPEDERAAFAMLSALSGNRHRVYTGVTVMQGEKTVTTHEETLVTFRELESDEISNYIATGEPMDKAGAYGIQGLGAMLVSGIEGDYFNVMGLPVFRLGRILADFGLDLLAMAAQ